MRRRDLLTAAAVAPVALISGRRRADALAAAETPRAEGARMKVGCQSGPTDEKRLRFFARHGVKNICGDLRDRKGNGPFTVDELERLRALCAANGVSLDMMRLPILRPTHIDGARRPAIMLGQSPERDRDIEEIHQTIASCARAGIPAVTYNLTLVGYQRNAHVTGRGGVRQTAWRLREAGEMAGSRTKAGAVSADVFWERVDYFLERVVPVAAEYKVRLCCHPHDPPTPPGFAGMGTPLGTVEGMKKFVSLRENAYHGLNFCQGTVAEMLQDPAREIYDVIRHFGRRKKIFNVHFRNIRGRRDDFHETFPDDGDIDFARAMRVYKEVGYQHMLMPDHTPKHPEDPDQLQAYAFCYGYIRGLIQAVG